jgi:hypothetical protein
MVILRLVGSGGIFWCVAVDKGVIKITVAVSSGNGVLHPRENKVMLNYHITRYL